jgi:hypothetical protein
VNKKKRAHTRERPYQSQNARGCDPQSRHFAGYCRVISNEPCEYHPTPSPTTAVISSEPCDERSNQTALGYMVGHAHGTGLVGFLPAGRNDIRVGRRHRGNKDPCHPGPRLTKIGRLPLDKVLEAIHRFAISTNGCSWIIWPVFVILPVSPSNAICLL